MSEYPEEREAAPEVPEVVDTSDDSSTEHGSDDPSGSDEELVEPAEELTESAEESDEEPVEPAEELTEPAQALTESAESEGDSTEDLTEPAEDLPESPESPELQGDSAQDLTEPAGELTDESEVDAVEELEALDEAPAEVLTELAEESEVESGEELEGREEEPAEEFQEERADAQEGTVAVEPVQGDESLRELREQRLVVLAKDQLDHGGKETAGTRQEAEAALGVEERDGLGPFRRPEPGEHHSGDFVDEETGTDWDVKRPHSRDVLQEKIRGDAVRQGRPEPRLNPNRTIKGEFDLDEELSAVRTELDTGENVIIDTRGLNPRDLAALRASLAGSGVQFDRTRVVMWP